MITMNMEASEVDIGGFIIKRGQNIDFKPDNEMKLTVGKVVEFKKAYNDPFDYSRGHSGIWMKITEIENAKSKFWISIQVWSEQYKSGLFSNHSQLQTENLINVSTELSDDDLPF
jgi:hypothetical protein